MSVTITCFGGAGEIGGNKILVEDGGKRLMLDFGMTFGRTGDYFDGVFLTKRAGRGLLDPLALGLVPPLRGLLRDDLVPALGARDEEMFWRHWQERFPLVYRDLRRDGCPAVDAFLVSHAHLDHIADLEYVVAEIPLAGTCTTAFISKVLQDVGGGSGAAYLQPAAVNGGGVLHTDRSAPSQRRPWLFLDGLPAGESVDDPLATAQSFWDASGSKGRELVAAPCHAVDGHVGPWRIRWWPVDHSIPGGAMFAIETDAGWVGYSGDIRFHGQLGPLTWQAAEELAELKPVALLCEGTRLTEPNATTEAQVYENCSRAVQNAAGKLAVADFAARNVERFEIFARIAEQTSRRLLVQPKDAYLLRAVHLADLGSTDLMASPHIGIYNDPKAVYRKYEAAVRTRYADRVGSPDEIRQHPGDYILAFSLTDMADLLDLQYLVGRQLGGVYIFSNSPAYDDEQQCDLLRLGNWVQHLGLTLVGLEPRRDAGGQVVAMDVQHGYHASGHAGGDELREFVQRIAPQTLIPIHTQASYLWPRMLAGQSIHIVMPQIGVTINV
jgi:ribonuclease J